jgi:hypothetical protein
VLLKKNAELLNVVMGQLVSNVTTNGYDDDTAASLLKTPLKALIMALMALIDGSEGYHYGANGSDDDTVEGHDGSTQETEVEPTGQNNEGSFSNMQV